MERAPFLSYTPIDGQWAKWNAEAILHFGKLFDLSPHNTLAGMGSMYLPNLPWLNPGALALALPFSETTRDIISNCIYATELAVSLVLVARTIGFCWPLATVAAQAHLYLLFPPFAEVFQVFNWYSLIPASAHLTALLNLVVVAGLHCGASSDWRRNLAWALGIGGLFICGLLSAPLTHFHDPAICRDGCRIDPRAAPPARRMGLEVSGGARLLGLRGRVRPAWLLPRNHCDICSDTSRSCGMGSSIVAACLVRAHS